MPIHPTITSSMITKAAIKPPPLGVGAGPYRLSPSLPGTNSIANAMTKLASGTNISRISQPLTFISFSRRTP